METPGIKPEEQEKTCIRKSNAYSDLRPKLVPSLAGSVA